MLALLAVILLAVLFGPGVVAPLAMEVESKKT